MTSESRTCKNCSANFQIDPDDFSFYEQMKVPPPTWCPECRRDRRLGWWAYRFLYKRKCDWTGDMVVTTTHPSMRQKVYRQDIWWSDKWDPKSYGKDFDFSRPFFDQWKELLDAVPMPALFTEYTTMINSEYCNSAATLKNCYLCFKADESEDCAYLNTITDMKDSFDCSFANFGELCYASVNLTKCSKIFFSQDCEECHDVWYSRDLVGCTNCIGCINLRNKTYHAFNQPVSKEEYAELLKDPDIKKKSEEFLLTQPRRQFHGYKNQDVRGDYLYNCKNVKDCYMVRNSENLRYADLLKNGPAANCMDYTAFATKAEWVYESAWVGINVNNIKFSFWCYKDHDLEYCFGCHGAGNLFGCIGIRGGEYCILNKQYNPEEYKILTEKIREHMRQTGEYGQFFPSELCPWPVNETNLIEWQALDKAQAEQKGFRWIDPDKRAWGPAHDDIMKCEECGRNYQYIQKEIDFHKRFNLVLPTSCPLCRDLARIRQLNPMMIFHRTCAKCQKDIETSYAPERPEIVYCVECYQKEVM